MKTTTKCERCQKMHGERTKCTDIMRDDATFDFPPEPPKLPEWRNDHGPACTCMACVLARGARRRGKAA